MIRFLLLAGLALALHGCGGCGSPDPVPTPDGGEGAAVSAALSSLDAAPTSLPADGTTTSTITVTVRDEAGQVMAGQQVSLSVTGAGNTLSANPRETDAAGLATFTLSSTRAETKVVTATVGEVVLDQLLSIIFLPDAAARLAIRVQPTNGQAGAAISPAVVVDVQDANGNLVEAGAPVVTATLGTHPAGATLSGTTTVTAADGEASFTDLSLDQVGEGYTLVFSSPGLASVETQAFDVLVGVPARLAFLVQPSSGPAGAPISPAVEVELQDAQGNRVDSAATVTLAIGTGPAGAALTGTASVAADAGVARFENVVLDRAGTYTLAATATGFQGATSAPFTLAAGSASQLAFSVQPDDVDVRVPFGVEVSIRDANGNLVSSATHTVTLTLAGNGSGALGGTTSVAAVGGIASFTDLTVDDEGSYTLQATAAGLGSATSAAFVVTDNLPPAEATLVVTSATQLTLTVGWTAVGDDGLLGSAAGYELRYDTTPLTVANFASGTPVTVGAPQAPGTAESATASGLTAGVTYHFGLRITDAAGNASFATASGTTATCPVGYTGAGCDQCAVGYQETSPGVCEDHCTNPDPCNPPPADSCNGNVLQSYPATRTCTPTTSPPFYTCAGPTLTDCSATGQLCHGTACVANPCDTTTCTPPAPFCDAQGQRVTWASTCSVDSSGSTLAAVCNDTSTATPCAASEVCMSGACLPVVPPAPGDLLVTEILFNGPAGRQWFEVHNLSSKLLDLSGMMVETVGGAAFTVSSSSAWVLQPGEYFVFGFDADPATNGGVAIDYAYGAQAPALDLGAPRHLRLSVGTTVVEALDYQGFATPPQDTALNLSSQVLAAGANLHPWYWCAATAALSGGGFGTPGTTNNDCALVVNPPVDFCRVQFPTDAGTVQGSANVTVYGRFYEPQVTTRNQAGNDRYPFVLMELGYGPVPQSGMPDPTTWTWTQATFNTGYGPSSPGFAANDDELQATLAISQSGSYLYGFRMALVDPATGVAGPAVYCDTAGVTAPSTGVYGTIEVVNPSADLAAARAANDGSGLDLDVVGAFVTAVKPPGLGSTDPVGFFLQGSQAGPALFVQVDPTTLSPVPAVGDQVSLTITAMGTTGGLRQATAISDYTRMSTGNAIGGLVKNVSNETDLVTDLVSYESELVTLTANIATAFGGGGGNFVSAQIETPAMMPDPNLRLRVLNTVRDALELVPGCAVTVTAVPMWRFNAQAQPLVWDASSITVHSCPPPKVISASAPSSTQVVVNFDRLLDPTTVNASGSQFSISPALAVTTAAVTGPRQVTLTTAPQSAGTLYTVTVASSVQDQHGTPVIPPDHQATFSGFSAVCVTPSVVISQIYGAGGNTGAAYTHDFIELHNRGNAPVSLAGWSVQYASATGTTWNKTDLAGSIPAGGFILVQQAGGTNGSPMPTPDFTGTASMSTSAGKVALANIATALTGSCPTADVVDMVGYGSTASCFSGSGPTPAPSTANAVIRQNNGCQDNNNNATNFVAAPPNPRNSSSGLALCGCT
jgi:hypothetical protein